MNIQQAIQQNALAKNFSEKCYADVVFKEALKNEESLAILAHYGDNYNDIEYVLSYEIKQAKLKHTYLTTTELYHSDVDDMTADNPDALLITFQSNQIKSLKCRLRSLFALWFSIKNNDDFENFVIRMKSTVNQDCKNYSSNVINYLFDFDVNDNIYELTYRIRQQSRLKIYPVLNPNHHACLIFEFYFGIESRDSYHKSEVCFMLGDDDIRRSMYSR
ncbi:hypothetical protein LP092_15015 (plasmid) [Moraxella bovis]|uniref:Uncharacterized protein n=1 Tax=Moraxella bovis TaxID=476 RepID=A0ABY6MB19_MORBO|nr:hypothetical protein [Moraxella bovis]UZA04787.1 hypothetical protein LP092_15015 [Moraxella bovis]